MSEFYVFAVLMCDDADTNNACKKEILSRNERQTLKDSGPIEYENDTDEDVGFDAA